MTVYLICEIVDLGYHVISGYKSKERAESELKTLKETALDEKIKGLMAIGYSRESAFNLVKNWPFYEIEEVDVVE